MLRIARRLGSVTHDHIASEFAPSVRGTAMRMPWARNQDSPAAAWDRPFEVEISGACKKCGRPLPVNERITYGRCENCYVEALPASGASSPSLALRLRTHKPLVQSQFLGV